MPVNIAVLTRVWSLAMLVTHSLPNSLTPVSKLDLCEPDMWRWQLTFRRDFTSLLTNFAHSLAARFLPSLPLLSLLVAHKPSLKDSPLTVKQQSLYCIPPSLSGPFFHNVHKSAGKMTLKSSEKINRISICYYLSQLGSLPTLVSNKLTNCCLIDFDRLWWQWSWR